MTCTCGGSVTREKKSTCQPKFFTAECGAHVREIINYDHKKKKKIKEMKEVAILTGETPRGGSRREDGWLAAVGIHIPLTGFGCFSPQAVRSIMGKVQPITASGNFASSSPESALCSYCTLQFSVPAHVRSSDTVIDLFSTTFVASAVVARESRSVLSHTHTHPPFGTQAFKIKTENWGSFDLRFLFFFCTTVWLKCETVFLQAR